MFKIPVLPEDHSGLPETIRTYAREYAWPVVTMLSTFCQLCSKRGAWSVHLPIRLARCLRNILAVRWRRDLRTGPRYRHQEDPSSWRIYTIRLDDE